MIVLAALVFFVSLSGLGMLLLAVHSAPEGYEDDLGFHRVR